MGEGPWDSAKGIPSQNSPGRASRGTRGCHRSRDRSSPPRPRGHEWRSLDNSAFRNRPDADAQFTGNGCLETINPLPEARHISVMKTSPLFKLARRRATASCRLALLALVSLLGSNLAQADPFIVD